ncbi:MAG: DUF3256 family protein [Bacteroidaceae bacterium]|nr:DUF3256 family protein [Bacteroidaceae bacterium]
MKQILLAICGCMMAMMPVHAQTMADVLRTMPDSVLPLLTRNDRLDLVDEWQGGVKAEVKNRLGGMVRLTDLSDSKASMQLSAVSSVTFEIVEHPDWHKKAVRMVHTCTTDGLTNRYERWFTLDWCSE